MSDDEILKAIAADSKAYWLKFRGCPIVYGSDPRFAAPPGPCFYCGEDHHHKESK